MSNHREGTNFIVGAIIGGLVGTVGALLLAPKAGKKIRQDLSDLYENFGERGMGTAEKFAKSSRNFASQLNEEVHDWTDRASDLLYRLKSGGCKSLSGQCHGKDFVIGALAGGALGVIAGLFFAPEPGDAFREAIMDRYEDLNDRTQAYANSLHKKGRKFAKTARSKTGQWLDLARRIVDDLADEGEELTEQFSEKVKHFGEVGEDRLSQVLDWASLGIKVWNKISRGR